MRREDEVTEVVESTPHSLRDAAQTPAVFGPALDVYVSGEHVPETDGVRALVPVGEWKAEEVLEAFRRWMRLDVADGKASPETIRNYFGDLRQHLEWLAEEGLSPAQAGEEDLKAYRAWLLEMYATSTVGRKLASVRRFYGMAQARGVLAENPLEGLKAPRDRTARHERVKWLPMEVIARILQTPKENTVKGIRDRAMLTLLAVHGLRVVEVQRLDLQDIDLEAGEAGTLRVLGKGDKWRTVLLVEETREVLRRWLAARNLMRADEPAVFLSLHSGRSAGSRLSRRGIRAMVDRYLELAGAKKEGVSCHALRHSYATLSLANGAQLLAISESLGHASVTTTQVYATIVDKAKHNPAKFLVGALG